MHTLLIRLIHFLFSRQKNGYKKGTYKFLCQKFREAMYKNDREAMEAINAALNEIEELAGVITNLDIVERVYFLRNKG